jgi:hypothetical protein
MIATFKTPAGKLNSEVRPGDIAGLLEQLQAWADKENQSATVTIHILPQSAQRASDEISKTLEKFIR